MQIVKLIEAPKIAKFLISGLTINLEIKNVKKVASNK